MSKLTDKSPMPFGKYKGQAMANVPAQYLLWLNDNFLTHQGVKDYIRANMADLVAEDEKVRDYKRPRQ